MSQGDGATLGATQAAEAVLGNLDEAGQPGADPLYGGGLLDLGRTLRRDQQGIMDAAVASNVLVPPDSPGLNPELLVTVENRGTDLMVNSTVNVSTRFGTQQLNITTLPPGETKTFKIQLPTAALDPDHPFRVQTSVSPGNGQVDRFPANNRRADVFEPDATP